MKLVKKNKILFITFTLIFLSSFYGGNQWERLLSHDPKAKRWLEQKRIQLDPEGMTFLNGESAFIKEGQVDYEYELNRRPWWVTWPDRGSLTWQVLVSNTDSFEVILCYSTSEDGTIVEIEGDDGKVTEILDRPIAPHKIKFAVLALKEKLQLRKGVNSLTLRILELKGDYFYLHQLRLVPVSAKKAVKEEAEKAVTNRASTDWLVENKYGVMFHWIKGVAPRHGAANSYSKSVHKFNVEAFAKMVEETGAGHVIFTVNHGDKPCPAPIKAWDKVHPGSTTDRDLIGEIAEALHKRDIQLILFIAPNGLSQVDGFFSCWDPSTWPYLPEKGGDEYFNNFIAILEEMGHRYGKTVAGYMFDGVKGIYYKYPQMPFERIFAACKAGNPHRVITWNSWILPILTDWQEYWSGEAAGPGTDVPESRYFTSGPAKGLQAHVHFTLEGPWAQTKINTPMPSPIYSNESLIGYVKACIANKVAVTLNMLIYQDGSVGEETMQQMKALRMAVRGY